MAQDVSTVSMDRPCRCLVHQTMTPELSTADGSNIKRFSNDELRQRFVDMIVPRQAGSDPARPGSEVE